MARQGVGGQAVNARRALRVARSCNEAANAMGAMRVAARRPSTLRWPAYIAVLGTHRAACHGDLHRMSGSEAARATFVVMAHRTRIRRGIGVDSN